jgi:Ca-activated chloride channel family protein
VTADGTDLDRVLVGRALGGPSLSPESFAHADEWRDAGVWLLILPVLLAPLAFRRGWLVAAALWLALAPSTRAEASLWADLWQRRDQQGAAALAGGDSEAAAGLFEDPAWRGAAQYEAGKFAEAAKTYRNLDGSASDYNLGNALARAGDLRAALAAYDDALAAKPEDADARFNRDLVERLLREQEEQKQSQQENQPQGEPSSGEQNQENEEQSSQPDGGAQQAQNQPRNEESSSDGQPSAAGSRSADEKRGGEDGSAQNDAPPRSQASATGEKHPETAAGEATPSDDGAKPDDGSELAQDGGTPGEDQVARSPGQHTDESQANSVSKQLDEVLDGNAPEAGPEPREKPATANAARGDGRPLSEEEQAREQRLRQVPDDPGGLLRAKIHRRYAEKRYAQEGLVPW